MVEPMLGIFDPYEIRARVLPAVLLTFPVPFAVLSLTFGLKNAGGIAAWTSAVSVAFLFAVAVYVRLQGFKGEDTLWALWDGPPSTRYLRWSNDKFPTETKQLISDKCQRLFGVGLPAEHLEKDNREAFDHQTFRVFTLMRGALHKWDKDGLWTIQNAYYGYARNLYGCRWVWSAIALATVVASLIRPLFFSDPWNWTIVVTAAYFVLVIAYTFWVLPKTAKGFADRYAENAVISFLLLDSGDNAAGR